MENKKTIVNVLAIFILLIVVINSIFAFGAAGSTGFVQIFLAIAVIAMVIAAMCFTKDSKESMPAIGAGLLYFGGLLVRGFFYLLDAFVAFIGNLSVSNLMDTYEYGDLTAEGREKILKKVEKLTESIDKDTFGEILDVLCIIIALALAAFAIFTLVQFIKTKDFSKTCLGRCFCCKKCQEAKTECCKTCDEDKGNDCE